jgi:3-oxoacyl-(acyl-carrier-protein) synthase III
MDNRSRGLIAGVGSYLPDQVVTSSHVNSKLNGLGYLNVGNMIETIVGVKERRHADEGVQASDLGVRAAIEALEDAKISPADIDTILYTSCSRDLGEPATASIIQAKLGAINAMRVMDVANACNSFLSGLELMNTLIACGLSRAGLVVSGERLSTFVNWQLSDPAELKRGFAALTLGDGGGAVVVTPGNRNESRGIRGSYFYSDGREWKLSVVMGGGTISPRNIQDSYFICDSLKLSKLAVIHLPGVITKVLELSGLDLHKDIDLVVPHQVSMSVIEKIAKRLNYPTERVMITLERYGNLGAASVPVALKEAIKEGRVSEGSNVMFVVGAAGFSAGAMIVTL